MSASVPSVEEVMEALEVVIDAALEQAEEIRTAYGGYPKADESKGIESAVKKVRAHRERLKAEREFVEACMEWGASDSEWRKCWEIDERRALRIKTQGICDRMLTAYRALAPSEEKR